MQRLPVTPAHRRPRLARDTRSPASALERYLFGDERAHPDLATLRAYGLTGHAFVRLPEHPQRDSLRSDFISATARHLATRLALAPLLRAWDAAGIAVLAFKGFQLAEFVYPSAGLRMYADVDLLVAETQAALACDMARSAGWRIDWRADAADDLLAAHGPEYLGHEAASLSHGSLDVRIDVHRRIVHNSHNRRPAHHVARRLSEAVMAAATVAHVEGAPVRIPQGVDALIVGLALNRCWGSDAWQVKPRDYADFEALIARYGLTTDAVLERARVLGVSRTVRTYLRRCDPRSERLVLGVPSWWERRWWNLRAVPERGSRDLERLPLEFADLAREAAMLVRMLPLVHRVRRQLRAGGSLSIEQLNRPARRRSGAPEGAVTGQDWRRLRRGLQRALRLLGVAAGERESAAALAAFHVLRQRGLDVRLAPAEPDAPAGIPRLHYRGETLEIVAGGVSADRG